MKKVSIIGFGRFGKTLFRLLGDDFDIVIYNRNNKPLSEFSGFEKAEITNSLEEIYKSEVIFFAVPMGNFEEVIKHHSQYFSNQTLIDVLSVKVHPKKIFEKYCSENETQIILTHPMFGPDSSKNGFDNLPIVLSNISAERDNYNSWKSFFQKRNLKIVEISAEEHDKLAAKSQSIAHYIGRSLSAFGLNRTIIDTKSASYLNDIVETTCNDTDDLFVSLQNYNPYAHEVRYELNKAFHKTNNSIFPNPVKKGCITIGIQGGKGSFNEQAILNYIKVNKIENFVIKYLYTTEKVLKELNTGKIDMGLFATHNSVGGIVQESLYASAKFRYKIVEELSVVISHHLMKLKHVNPDELTTIMAHPQVLKQCVTTLKTKHPKMIQTSGEGRLIDTAEAAKALADGEIDDSVAILGNKTISDIYDLEIIESNLQDSSNNLTSFLLVSRD